ncbi:hypothetical protein Tco_0580741 [Tanacetum coccineum]
MENYGKTYYHGYGVTGLWLRRNTFEAYKLKTFLRNSVSNLPQPILGFGNKVCSNTSDRRKVEGAMYRVTNLVLGVCEWLKFNNRNFSLDSRKEFRKRLTETRIKEIECLEGLDIEEFDDRRFVSQAWNRLFRIKEQVVREYVMELLSSFTYRDHIEELDEADTMVFQLGGEKRSRHSKNEKVTMDDLFLLHSIDGGVSVDVLWHVAKFLCDKAKGSKRKSPIVGAHLIGKIASYYGLMTLGSLMNITLGPETSSMSVAELVDLGICKYNGLGIGETVAEIPEVVGDDDVGARQAEIGGWRTEQERFISWNTDHLSQLLAHHHIDHTRYDRTHYSYVPSIPDLGVQSGVNFMSGTPGYSTAPSPYASQFGMFGDAHPFTSRNQDDMNED